MKKFAAILMLGTVLVTPEIAFAKDLKLTAQVASYNGPPTYFAIYLVKPDGSYAQTLHVAGERTKYLRHLRDWVRAISTSNDTIDAITGASVGSGQTLSVNVSLADALIDAGYTIKVDSAVEDGNEYPSEIAMPLTSANSGVPMTGQGYVQTLTVTM